jgi:hypothetical protein
MSTRRRKAPIPILPLLVAAAALGSLVGLQQGWIDSPFGNKQPAAQVVPAKARQTEVNKGGRKPRKSQSEPAPTPAEPAFAFDDKPVEPPPKVEPPKSAARLAYEEKAKGLPDKPRPWVELAHWSESNATPDEVRDAWRNVIRFDPNHAEARKALGFKRSGSAWKTDAMIADQDAQKKADLEWGHRLKVVHRKLHVGKGENPADAEAARAELAAITDVRAAPKLWDEFGGHRSHHLMLAEKLATLESTRSSLPLAALAGYSPDPKAERIAIEALKRHDPVDFARPLIAILGPELKYRRAALPTAPGEPEMMALEVEDERFAKRFVYFAAKNPGDVSSEAFGDCSAMVRWANFGWDAEGKAMARQMNAENARASRQMAEAQLQSDIQAVKDLNIQIRTRNDRVHRVLTETTGHDDGLDRDAWNHWLAAKMGVKYTPPTQVAKVMMNDFVQPLYQPTFIAIPPTPT